MIYGQQKAKKNLLKLTSFLDPRDKSVINKTIIIDKAKIVEIIPRATLHHVTDHVDLPHKESLINFRTCFFLL